MSLSRPLHALLAATLLLALSACGSDGSGENLPTAPPEAAPPGSRLIGTVGTEQDPEAYEIVLTTSEGRRVESLTPGRYTVEIRDLSTTHNFNLSGPGVSEASSVPEVETRTLELDLAPGTYTYVCDPHPSMTGSFTVAA